MRARCNRCTHDWRVRKLQTSNRRCPNCRSYDLDYFEWGKPFLPSKPVPHEVGDAFVRKRILPLFGRWEQCLLRGDAHSAMHCFDENQVLLRQAKRRNAETVTLTWAWLKHRDLFDRTIAMMKENTRKLQMATSALRASG